MAEIETQAPADDSGFKEWRRLVEKGLKGRDFASLRSATRDGIVIEPLYIRFADTFPLPGRGARSGRVRRGRLWGLRRAARGGDG